MGIWNLIKYIEKWLVGDSNLVYSCNKKINGENEYLEIYISNLGKENYLLKAIVAKGKFNKSSICPWQDGFDINELLRGKQVKVVPAIIEPGSTKRFNTWSINTIQENQKDPQDEKIFYDPWIFIVLIDGANNLNFINIDEILFKLGNREQYRPSTFKDHLWYKIQLRIAAKFRNGKI